MTSWLWVHVLEHAWCMSTDVNCLNVLRTPCLQHCFQHCFQHCLFPLFSTLFSTPFSTLFSTLFPTLFPTLFSTLQFDTPSNLTLTETYDLKGSTSNRYISARQQARHYQRYGKLPTLKDINYRHPLELLEKDRAQLCAQLEVDTKW